MPNISLASGFAIAATEYIRYYLPLVSIPDQVDHIVGDTVMRAWRRIAAGREELWNGFARC